MLFYVFFILCLVLLILINLASNYHNIYEHFSQEETIFVSIPSYRDVDCKNTLNNLFQTAKYPELIYVGVFEQNEPSDPEEHCRVDPKYQNNVRYKTIHYSQAKGPFYARAIINNHLYRGEKYYLMIDAHTLFLSNWDVRMKDQLNYLRNHGVSKPIISSYPHHLDFAKSREIVDEKRNVTTLICDIINAKKYPTETLALEKPSGKFYKSLLLGAGYIFSYGEFFREIKMDENLQHIFSGEEILLAILAYTHGWDIYSPAYMNLFHFYNHKKPNWYKDNIIDSSKVNNEHIKNNRTQEKTSYHNLEQLIDRDINHPCMGTNRNIQDFWKELGFFRDKNNMSDKFPSTSKQFRCDKTPVIDYPIKELFTNSPQKK